MAGLILERVNKRFASRQVLGQVSLEIPEEGRIVIDGRVGCASDRWVPPQQCGVGWGARPFTCPTISAKLSPCQIELPCYRMGKFGRWPSPPSSFTGPAARWLRSLWATLTCSRPRKPANSDFRCLTSGNGATTMC